MTVTARLDPATVTIDAGGSAVARVLVRNGGRKVEAYHLEVVGEPAAWARVEPAELSLYPDEEKWAEVVLTPPRSSAVPAGDRPFGVRVRGTDDPDDVTVPEGRIEVLPFTDVSVELTPRTSRGRTAARHELAVDNRGNVPVRMSLGGEDPDEAVTIGVQPAELLVEPGRAAFARVRVRPVRRRWTGPSVTHPFRVAARPEAGDGHTADGSMLQEALLPPWLGKAAAATAVVAALLALAWVSVLRPAVRTAAQDAVQEPVAAVRASAEQAGRTADEAQQAAGSAETTAGQAGQVARDAAGGNRALGETLVEKGVLKPQELPATGTGTPSPGTPQAPAGTSFSQRLAAEVNAGGSATRRYQVPADQRISVTDVFYENPQGDTGTVEVSVNGEVLFRKALANFRDLDDHFVTPVVLQPGNQVTFRTNCATAGDGAAGGQCRTALVLFGESAVRPAG